VHGDDRGGVTAAAGGRGAASRGRGGSARGVQTDGAERPPPPIPPHTPRRAPLSPSRPAPTREQPPPLLSERGRRAEGDRSAHNRPRCLARAGAPASGARCGGPDAEWETCLDRLGGARAASGARPPSRPACCRHTRTLGRPRGARPGRRPPYHRPRTLRHGSHSLCGRPGRRRPAGGGAARRMARARRRGGEERWGGNGWPLRPPLTASMLLGSMWAAAVESMGRPSPRAQARAPRPKPRCLPSHRRATRRRPLPPPRRSQRRRPARPDHHPAARPARRGPARGGAAHDAGRRRRGRGRGRRARGDAGCAGRHPQAGRGRGAGQAGGGESCRHNPSGRRRLRPGRRPPRRQSGRRPRAAPAGRGALFHAGRQPGQRQVSAVCEGGPILAHARRAQGHPGAVHEGDCGRGRQHDSLLAPHRWILIPGIRSCHRPRVRHLARHAHRPQMDPAESAQQQVGGDSVSLEPRHPRRPPLQPARQPGPGPAHLGRRCGAGCLRHQSFDPDDERSGRFKDGRRQKLSGRRRPRLGDHERAGGGLF